MGNNKVRHPMGRDSSTALKATIIHQPLTKRPGNLPRDAEPSKSKKKRKGATVVETKLGTFERSKSGCYLRGNDGNQIVCGWIGFTRLITNVDDGTVSVEIKYYDLDNKPAHLVVHRSELTRPGEIIKKLMDHGFKVDDVKTAGAFLEALYRQVPPTKRAKQVSMPGWHKTDGGQYAYLGNGFTAAPEGCETGLLLDGRAGNIFQSNGTLKGWQKNVGKLCRGNPRLILPVCATLASPLLLFVHQNNFGIHFFGKTSEGKTTGYIVSASLSGPISDIRDWNATENAFVATAKGNNDSVTTYDEIGSAHAKDVKKVAYHLMNGRDRGRAKSDGTAGKLHPFRCVILSNGEFDYPKFFANENIKIMPGQIVRFLNIPVHADSGNGMFIDLHGCAESIDFVKLLAEKTSQYYGTVLPAFIRAIVDSQDTIAETAKTLMAKYAKRLKRALPEGYQVDGREERVIGCFALMAYAGELAIEKGILTWDAGEAFAAIRTCFLAWVKHDRNIAPLNDAEICAQIKRFFKSESDGKLVPVADYDESNPPEGGFIKKVDGNLAFLVHPEFFESVICQRWGKAAGIRVLLAHGLLILGAEGRPRKQVLMPANCGGKKLNFYVVRAKIAD
jgi:putative DNA primase/helicase